MRYLVIAILLTGCAITPPDYDYHHRTYIPLDTDRSYEPVNAKAFVVEDKNILIKYTPDIVDAGVQFEFQNKSSKPISIVWDQTTFINAGSQSERVFHDGVIIKDRNTSLPPTLIPPTAKHADMVIPTSRVDWASSDWLYEPLCGVRVGANLAYDDSVCMNKNLSFFFTYEIDGVKKNLTATFKLTKKTPRPKKTATAKT